MAILAGGRGGNLHFGGLAFEGVFQADFHVEPQVRALPGGLAAFAVHHFAEHFFEQVREPAAAAEIEVETARSLTAAVVFKGGMAEAVIGGALLIVLQDVIGFVQFLEIVRRFRVVGIAVRMVLHGQFAVSLFQLIRRRAAFDPQNLIIIFFAHADSTTGAPLGPRH